jgi:hypothetical protein
MYLYGQRSASNLGFYRRGRSLGAPRRRRRLGDIPSDYNAAITGYTGAPIPASGDSSFFVPGSSVGDVLYNAVYGNLSPNQQANLVAQEQASLVQAGTPPAAAVQQAQTDVTDTLDTVTAPGAFGVTWTGAAPDQPGFPSAAASAAGSAIANTLVPTLSAIPSWAWWVGGGIGALFLFFAVRKAL